MSELRCYANNRTGSNWPTIAYDVCITSTSGEPLVAEKAEAKLEHGLTVLRVEFGMSSAKPGKYLLQLRTHASEWSSFPLQVR